MKKLNFAWFVHISCLVLALNCAGSGASECGDPECKTPIAEAYATINYKGGGEGKVDLRAGERFVILGRNVGKEKHFLVRKPNGAEGLANKNFVRDTKVLIKQKDLVTVADGEIEPSATVQPDVVDGTTLNAAEVAATEATTPEEVVATPVEEKTPELQVVPSGVNQESNSLPAEVEEAANVDKGPEVVVNDAKSEPEADEEEDEGEDEDADNVDEEEDAEDEEGEDEQEVDEAKPTEPVQPVEVVPETTPEPTASIPEPIKESVEEIVKPEEPKPVEEVVPEPVTEQSSTETVTEAVTPAPVVEEPEIVPPVQVEVTTATPVVDSPTPADVDVQNETVQPVEEVPSPVDIVVDDPRQEIPVTEEPELPPQVANANVIEEKQDAALPKPPHGLLRGGLGSLLSHSHHHHHHHHHHGSHDHSGHDHHGSHEHDEPPFIAGLGQGSVEAIPRREPPPPPPPQQQQDQQQKPPQEEVVPENGFCDSVSCPQPVPGQVPPQQQHSNGFHHPMVSAPPPQVTEEMASNYQEMAQEKVEEVEPSLTEEQVSQEEVDYAQMFITELFKLSDLIMLLAITSFTLIVFSLGHYLINKNRKEKPLIYKLNMVERDLMASHKENAMLKADLAETRHKLTSIENNSFGSNDMVIALRQELEDSEQTKLELQEQITSLEKELENAAEAGLELNKMVAELLNQSGSDSIAITVDELQRQLNEQQQTILSMNTTLADKSRENSELQITLANQSTRFTQELEELQQTLNDLKLEKNNVDIELANLQSGQNSQLDTLRKETSAEIAKLNKEVKSFQSKYEESKKAASTAEAKVEALEECIKDIKRGTNTNGTVDGLIDSAELKAQLAVLKKEKSNLQDRLQGEVVARQLLDDHVKIINDEISTLKKEYSQAEKDKLEAETRLEVLSSYFKDKETQLQKELSIKEAMWMQQQGETTSTVERIRFLQDEVQQLKSQNEKLRAEIQTLDTAHKAQYTKLETQSHDAWLAARQAERRLEESRNEASTLRRKLTVLVDGGGGGATTDGLIQGPVPPPADLSLTAPSPIRVESPNAPPLMGLPPPPFMPPPFGPPFMPPFMPPPGPGEMRPAPLGRLMSPPPNRYSPSMDARDHHHRYSPDRGGRYSPDSRYDYSVMSNYETETDFSPPRSPSPPSRRSNYDRDHRDHRRDRDRDVRERDGRTSGSGGGPDRSAGSGGGGGYPKAFSPPSMRTTSPPIQDPRNKKYQGGFSSGSQDSVATRKSGKQYKT